MDNLQNLSFRVTSEISKCVSLPQNGPRKLSIIDWTYSIFFRWASKSIWVSVLVVGWFIRLTENRIDPKCSMSSPNEFVYIRFNFLLKFFLSIVSSAYNYFQAQMRPFVTPLKYTLQWFRSFSLSCSIHLSWDNWLRYSLLLTSLYGNNKIHLMKNFQVSKGDSVFVLLFQTYRFWMSKIEIDIEIIQY